MTSTDTPTPAHSMPFAKYTPHVPLVLNGAGERLAKRDGAVTLSDLAAAGWDAAAVRGRLAASLGLADGDEPVDMTDLLERFDPGALPRAPWVFEPPSS